MANPFEDENGTFHVLVNDEGQHSLWPHFIDVPAGWRIAHAADSRPGCLAYVEKNWTDLRPKSLIEHMNGTAGGKDEQGGKTPPSSGSQKLN